MHLARSKPVDHAGRNPPAWTTPRTLKCTPGGRGQAAALTCRPLWRVHPSTSRAPHLLTNLEMQPFLCYTCLHNKCVEISRPRPRRNTFEIRTTHNGHAVQSNQRQRGNPSLCVVGCHPAGTYVPRLFDGRRAVAPAAQRHNAYGDCHAAGRADARARRDFHPLTIRAPHANADRH